MSNPVRASGYVACGVCLGCVLEVGLGVVCCAYGLSVVEFGLCGLGWVGTLSGLRRRRPEWKGGEGCDNLPG